MLRTSIVRRHRSRGINVWYVRIFDTETKAVRYESLGTERKAEAQAVLQERIRAGDFSPKAKGAKATVGELAGRWIAAKREAGLKESTCRTYECAMSLLKGVWGVQAGSLTREAVEGSAREAMEGRHGTSYSVYRTICRQFLTHVFEGLELTSRDMGRYIPAVKRRPKFVRSFWTLSQVERILDRMPTRESRLACAFMAFAGLRIAEALATTPDKVRGGFVEVLGKGDKFAKVPLSSRLAAEIEDAGGAWDFSGLSKESVSRMLRKAAKEAIPEGFEGEAHPHRFRHSFGSNLVRAGVNVKAVQMLMRHGDIQTTLNVYAHLLDEDLAGAIEKMFERK